MQSARDKKALIDDILSVINDADNASLKAIKEFAPYISDRGAPLPFLCKSPDDFSKPVDQDEYQVFLKKLADNLYPSYFKNMMDFNNAVKAVSECIISGNYVASDLADYICNEFDNGIDNTRLTEIIATSLSNIKNRSDFANIIRTKGDCSYYAYQIYLALKKKVGVRSKTLTL